MIHKIYKSVVSLETSLFMSTLQKIEMISDIEFNICYFGKGEIWGEIPGKLRWHEMG